jgi:uncharacterized membrane protein YkoI
MSMFSRLLLPVAVAAAMIISPAAIAPAVLAPAMAQGTECLSDAEVQAAIEAGEIQSWPKIKRLAKISGYEEVSDVQVCLQDGVPYYYVNVVSPYGDAKKIVVNAIDGSL